MLSRSVLTLETSGLTRAQSCRKCYSITIPVLRQYGKPRPSLNAPSRTTLRLSHPRFFSSSPARRAEELNHYDVLGVSPSATKSELKKQFYVLSKETHPDINRDNPNANERFVQISEAYSVLGNEEKRKKYDRDVMPRFTRRAERGTRSSAQRGGYAGSRAPTGLSKRRGTFRGPPPSFYGTSDERSEQDRARQHAAREQAAYDRASSAGRFDASSYADAGQWDPVFNSDPILRTQTAEDRRRLSRREQEMAEAQRYAEEQSHFWERFIVVSGIIALGVGVGTMVQRMSAAPRGGLTRADGSLRGGEENRWAGARS